MSEEKSTDKAREFLNDFEKIQLALLDATDSFVQNSGQFAFDPKDKELLSSSIKNAQESLHDIKAVLLKKINQQILDKMR